MKHVINAALIVITVGLVILAIMGTAPRAQWHQAPAPPPSLQQGQQHGKAP